MTVALTENALRIAVDELAARDPDLASIVEQFGRPPLWPREPGFSTLAHLILEQQVSLASAQAAFDRMQTQLSSTVTPQGVLSLDDDALLRAGVSRQKRRYLRALAEAILNGAVDLALVATLPDADARSHLTSVIGIGNWTADVYLLMALRRPDAWPTGDLALQVAARDVKGLPQRPSSEELELLAEQWRPHRATAARLLWLQYLASRGLPR